MKYTGLNIILLLGLGVLLVGVTWSAYQLHEVSSERERVKEDYSLTNSVTFGLFSVDQWRDRIADVIDGQIQDYHITKDQQQDLQRAVEKELHHVVNQTIAEINKPQKSLGGKLKKMTFNALVDSKKLQVQVRPFAQTIVAKISSPESVERLKSIAGSKVSQLEKQTYDSTSESNYAVTQYVYHKYRVNNPVDFNKRIANLLISLKANLIRLVCTILGCVLAALLLWWILRKQVHLQMPLFIFALLFSLVLLIVGSTVPIIEVDARIKTLDLLLFGQKVHFENQILFYQSKSIIGIISRLITQQKPDAIAVGILIMLSVLILPLVRLIAKGVHLLSPKSIADHPVIRYMTFNMGKWDMADVMIVGMLMTYIGLNGILKSQLSALNIHTASLNVVTVNGTSLQPGYFIFTGYVLFAILLSYILKRIRAQTNTRSAG